MNILPVFRVSFETRGSLTIVVGFPLVVKIFLFLKCREQHRSRQGCPSVRLDKIPARKASINRLRHLGKSVAKAFGSKATLKVGGGDSIPKRFLRRSDQTVYKFHKFRSEKTEKKYFA